MDMVKINFSQVSSDKPGNVSIRDQIMKPALCSNMYHKLASFKAKQCKCLEHVFNYESDII